MLIPGLIFHDIWSSNDSLRMSVTAKSKPSTISAGSIASNALFYYHAPDDFMQQFSECMFELESCHVLYWHVQKTGGSYIASRLYPVYNNRAGYNSREWCCNDKFMKQSFWPNVEMYCSKKLGVYEVRSEEYQQVVQACQSLNDTVLPKQHRYIGFVSIREPIERTLSAIHQRCNVHSSKLDAYTRAACECCSYDDDAYKPFFEKFVNETNNVYIGLKQRLLSNHLMDIPIYMVDNEQIDDFFSRLEDIVNHKFKETFENDPHNRSFQFPGGKSNAEASQKLCDFGMPSALMKQHRVSLDIYHWIWSGGYLGI